VLAVTYVRVTTWLTTSYRQTYRIRVALLQAVLRQEIGWFDTHDAGELGTRLAESVLFYLISVYPSRQSLHLPRNTQTRRLGEPNLA